jgi:hypothetical protein
MEEWLGPMSLPSAKPLKGIKRSNLVEPPGSAFFTLNPLLFDFVRSADQLTPDVPAPPVTVHQKKLPQPHFKLHANG